MRREAVVEELLKRHGRSYAGEAGVRLRDEPSPLYRLLVLATLLSARISAATAVSAAQALSDAGWRTPRAMAGATWAERTRVLNRAGYARYDESTSRRLAAGAELLLSRWGGDLRRLRAEAGGSLPALRGLLTTFNGIGPVGADIFCREVQDVWPEIRPFVDARVREAAARLGLPTGAGGLARLAGAPTGGSMATLTAALVRCGLAGDADEILPRGR